MRNQNTMMIAIGLIVIVLIGFFVIKKIMHRKNVTQTPTEFMAPVTTPMGEDFPVDAAGGTE